MGNKTVLIAVAKNEACYIAEWIYHHLHFGFDYIYIGVNRTDDASKDILGKISDRFNNVFFFDTTWIDFSANSESGYNRNIQTISYAYLINIISNKHDDVENIFPLDIDEFWFPLDFKTKISDYISRLPAAECYSFNWVSQYGEKEVFAPPFKDKHFFYDRHVKSLFKLKALDKVISLKCHTPLFEKGIRHVDSMGKDFVPHLGQKSENLNKDHYAYILHRLMRSEREYDCLLLRGNPEFGDKIKNNRAGFVLNSDKMKQLDFEKGLIEKYHAGLLDFIDNLSLSSMLEKEKSIKINDDGFSINRKKSKGTIFGMTKEKSLKKEMVGLPSNTSRAKKIFQIGFNKCATGSIYQLFINNGFSAVHWDGGDLSKSMYINDKAGELLLSGYEEKQVFTDMEHHDGSGKSFYAYQDFYKKLDDQYPESLFILNYRSIDKWIASRLKHPGYLNLAMKFSGLTKDEVIKDWKEHYKNHIQDVLNYFNKKNNLLVLDLEKSSQNSISDFLKAHNITLSEKSLPHTHKTDAKSDPIDSHVNNLRDAALFFESIKNISFARDIMSIAFKFRPHGATIKRKFNEYLSLNEFSFDVLELSLGNEREKEIHKKNMQAAARYFQSKGNKKVSECIFDILNKLNSKAEEGANNAVETNKSLFLHIPKTAGTSFRRSLLDYDVVCQDYGRGGDATSDLIARFVYEKDDFYKAYNEFNISEFRWLCGHFHLDKYLSWFYVSEIVVFLRDPFEQIISHFNHVVRNQNYAENFVTFYKTDKFVNIQSKFTDGLPIELIGVVGITERYTDSLSIVNRNFKGKYEEKLNNVAPFKTLDMQSISEKDRNNLDFILQKDLKLYKKAVALMEERLKVEKAGFDWCYAKITLDERLVLSGCAFYKESKDFVVLSVFIGGVHYKDIPVNEFYPLYPKATFPRKRYIGFSLSLAQVIEGRKEVEVVVKRTNQNIMIENHLILTEDS